MANIPQLKLGNIRDYSPSNIFTRARLVYTRHVGEYSPAKTGEYSRIFPNFQNCARCEKDLKDNKHNSLHLERKYARIFVLGHYLFLVIHSYSEQIMSVDKYPSIFSRQMEAIVYLLYSWRFSRYSAPIHWLVHCHMTSNNETVPFR